MNDSWIERGENVPFGVAEWAVCGEHLRQLRSGEPHLTQRGGTAWRATRVLLMGDDLAVITNGLVRHYEVSSHIDVGDGHGGRVLQLKLTTANDEITVLLDKTVAQDLVTHLSLFANGT